MTEETRNPAPAMPSSRNLILVLGGIAMMSGLLVVMTYELRLANVSFADFRTVLENFVNVTETWMGQVKEFTPGGEKDLRESMVQPDAMA